MNFLTKIVVWISVAMITGFFNCGLALAEGENQQATTSTTVERGQQDKDKDASNQKTITNGEDLTARAFEQDRNIYDQN